MNEIRIWAANLSVILIITGIMIKTVSFKSEKVLLKFVATMLIAMTVFQLNTDTLKNELSFDITDEVSESTYEKSRELSEELLHIGENEVRKVIENGLKEFDKNILTEITVKENKILVTFRSEIISDAQMQRIENELESEIKAEIITERDDGLEE